jgi:nucleoside-diphosphate-sugar epimerase
MRIRHHGNFKKLSNKILITGGQGYLGGRVAKHFLLNNFEVKIASTKKIKKAA